MSRSSLLSSLNPEQLLILSLVKQLELHKQRTVELRLGGSHMTPRNKEYHLTPRKKK